MTTNNEPSDNPADAESSFGDGENDRIPDRLATAIAAHESAPRLPFVVIGIGASAGGLEAYTELLQNMPSTSGLAFVLIQHLSPSRQSMVADILGRHTRMPVTQVQDSVEVQPDQVYVIRPGQTMTIKDGRLHLGASLLKAGHSRPMDGFALVRESLRDPVRKALQQALPDGKPATIRDAAIETEMGRRRVTVGVRLLDQQAYPSHYLVSFYDYPDLPPIQTADSADAGEVSAELQRIRDELQNTIEELQTSNEELTTVNAQLQAKMEELERTSNDLSSLLTSTDIGVIFLDTRFRIRRYTPAITQLMDLIPSDLGRPLNDMARKFEDPWLTDDVRTVLERLAPIEREIRSEDGRFYVRRVLPYRTMDNRIDGIVVTFVDVSERRLAVDARGRAEEELKQKIELEQQARAQAEAASSAKDDFLANVSHELRTPLSAILLWAKMLRKGVASPDQFEEGAAAIVKSAEAQQELIEDLLDTTRIASGKLRLNPQDARLVDVVSAAVDAIRPAAQSKSITIQTEYGKDVGVVRIDADRIRQVVWNLLSNAVKFTPTGGRVEVGLCRCEGQVELRVSDTGRGIAPEVIHRIFERFSQIDPADSGPRGGLGLGLTICRQLVELHGGTIEARSKGENAGSTFIVLLPLPRLAEDVSNTADREPADRSARTADG